MRVHVPSLSKPGITHTVSGEEGETLSCDCPRFDFSPAAAKRCRHTDLVRRADALLEKCQMSHNGLDIGLCRACLVALLALVTRKATRQAVDAVREGKLAAREQAKARKARSLARRRG